MTKLQKLRRSLRAISPVVAVLLMIAIAVVASLVAYAWIMGYIGFQTGKTGQAIQITSFAEGADENHMRIYVQNVGQGEAEINSVFINDESVPIDEPADLTIAKGATITLVVDLGTDSWTSGEQVKIKVITEDGTFAEKQGTGSGGTSGTPAPTWTVTSSVSGTGGSISPLGARTVTQGNSITFTITPADGFDIADVLVDGSSVGAVSSYQFTNVQEDHTIVASFEEEPSPTYQFTANTAGSGSGTVTPSNGQYSDTITVTANPADSSDFAGWSGDLSGMTNPQQLLMDGPKSVTATFNVKQYTITVTQTANGNINPGTGTYNYGSTPSFTITPDADYLIESITVNGSPVTVTTPAGQTYQFSPLTGAGTITATFGLAPVGITVTSSPVGAGYVTVDGTPITTPQTFNWVPGTSHTIAANSPVSGGTGTQYVYTGWSDSGAQSHSYTVPSAPATVTASFQTQYQVVLSQTGVDTDFTGTVMTVGTTDYDRDGATVWVNAGGSCSFSYATPLVVTADTKQYVLTGVNATSPLTINEPTWIIGDYKTQYWVEFAVSPSGAGTTTPAVGANWQDAGTLAISATGSGGYIFDSWTATGSITIDSPTSATINGAGTITATFTGTGTLYPEADATYYSNGGTRSSPYGSYTRMQSSDNSDYESRCSRTGMGYYTYYNLNYYLQLDIDDIGITESQITNMDITLESSYSTTKSQTVSIYNFATSSWESKDTQDIGTSDVTVTFSITSGFSNYVDDGGNIRIGIQNTGSSPTSYYYHYIDFLKIDIQYT